MNEQNALMAALDELSDRLYRELRETAAEIMAADREDASNEPLLALRAVQVAYGISSRAHREWDRATTGADGTGAREQDQET